MAAMRNKCNIVRKFAAYSIVILTACFVLDARADIPLLERPITLSLEQERIDIALKKISQQGDFTFSYNPSILDVSKLVTVTFAGNTVREVLDRLFDGGITYKARGSYIILTKAKISPTSQVYSGYVVDEATGLRLKNVSVYDPVTLSSVVTDDYGYFQIEVEKPSASDVRLAINKLNYVDTVIYVSPDKEGLLRIPISNSKEKLETIADSVSQKLRRFWNMSVSALQSQNILNIQDTIYRTTQVSLFPFIGTNHRLSANVINDYSFNIYGGYALGVEKFEVGSLFNINRGYVHGVQLAGVFNVVGGETDALQFAGIANVNIDSVKRAQFAGLINLNWNSTRAFSAAGLLNVVHGNSQSVHLAGLSNVTVGHQRGAHLAGLFNLATGSAKGVQLAGLFNFSAQGLEGFQGSGLINFSGKEVRGAQLAGLINIAPGSVKGAQVSGLINYATRVHGVQVGVLNIADSVRGVPIGLLSIVRKGYHQIELSADEVFYTNAAFRSGVSFFYNILTAGAKTATLNDTATIWTFGYGFGTAPKINRWLRLNLDLTSNQIVNGADFESINMINKFYTGAEFRLAKNFGVTVGVTINAYMTDATATETKLFADFQPDFVFDRTYSNDLNVKMWWGGKVGLRFF